MYGGSNSVTLNLCNELKNKYDVTIISISESNGRKINIDGVKLIDLDNPINRRIVKVSLLSFFRLRKIFKREKFDIIFMVEHRTSAVVIPASLFLKSKIVFCDHGALSNQTDDFRDVVLRKIGSKFSSKTIVLTDRNLNDYNKILKISKNKLQCIYNFCDDKFFDNLEKYNIKSKSIISVGRLSKEKGFDLAIEVARNVLSRHRDWIWHLYGDGPERDNLENLIYENNLQDRFILMGSCNNIHEIYKNYSLFVLTSYREGLPLVLLEAKINKIPCVSFDCITGPREILSDGEDGFLIPCYDVNSMSEKINLLIEDENLKLRLSGNCRHNLYKFDKQNIMNEWISLIEELS